MEQNKRSSSRPLGFLSHQQPKALAAPKLVAVGVYTWPSATRTGTAGEGGVQGNLLKHQPALLSDSSGFRLRKATARSRKTEPDLSEGSLVALSEGVFDTAPNFPGQN